MKIQYNSNNKRFIPKTIYKNMANLVCSDYGFDCDFVSEGDSMEDVIEIFGKHTEEEHGIEYQKEVLKQFLMRKSGL